jgi:hypothetical protein
MLIQSQAANDEPVEMAGEYFRHYRKLVYLAQTRAPAAIERARQIAQRMGFEFEHRFTGYGGLGERLGTLVSGQDRPAWQA